MSESFHTLRGSWILFSIRRVCSSEPTSSQYLSRMMPESTMAFSTAGTCSRKRSVWAGVQKPITRSTPARLYQLRSKITTSPAAGKCLMYRWMYICDLSRSVGDGNATTRKTRGLTRSTMRLIVPPLEHDAHLGTGRLHPLLHGHEPRLQHRQLRLVGLPTQFRPSRGRVALTRGPGAQQLTGVRLPGLLLAHRWPPALRRRVWASSGPGSRLAALVGYLRRRRSGRAFLKPRRT